MHGFKARFQESNSLAWSIFASLSFALGDLAYSFIPYLYDVSHIEWFDQ